jgi:hypothetical protein
VDSISAPPIPTSLEWVNVASLRMDKQLGRPVLVDFWDFCSAHSMRVLPYIRTWHRRYAEAGLRVISVHAGNYAPSRDPEQVRAAVARLGIEHPVVLDPGFELWRRYGNEGWPARYLFGPDLRLHTYHYGEGGYAETEAAIAGMLAVEPASPEPLRPEDVEGVRLAEHTPEQPGAYSGPYEAGGVWAVIEGAGSVRANGVVIAVEHAGSFPLVEHERHTAGVLDLQTGPGTTCHAVQFTPGLWF